MTPLNEIPSGPSGEGMSRMSSADVAEFGSQTQSIIYLWQQLRQEKNFYNESTLVQRKAVDEELVDLCVASKNRRQRSVQSDFASISE